MRIRLGWALLFPGLLSAQTLRIPGLAFDSLSNRPLPGAFVTVGARSAFADSLGRFVIDSIAPGSYRATLQHDRLDSLGLIGITATVVVKSAADTIRIASPSARTMWRRVCPNEAPYDSGFVFGAVRTAVGQRPVSGAPISAIWIDLRGSGATVRQKEFQLESTTSQDGSYVLCGLPFDTNVRLSLARDSVETGVDISLSRTAAIRRRDITLIDPTAFGVVRGMVTLKDQPVSNVRINVGGTPELRTGQNGRFVVRKVPAGTQIIDVQGIGFAPISQVVDVRANDTVDVAIAVDRITVLDSVIVRAPSVSMHLAKEFDDRRRRAIGYFKDSTTLGKEVAIEGVFNNMASVSVRRPPAGEVVVSVGTCSKTAIFVDGQLSHMRFSSLRPEDLAAIEVYRKDWMPPEIRESLPKDLTMMRNPPCAYVLAWTKNRFRP